MRQNRGKLLHNHKAHDLSASAISVATMGLSQMYLLPLQHCKAAGALLQVCWPSGIEFPLHFAAEMDGLLNSTTPPAHSLHIL